MTPRRTSWPLTLIGILAFFALLSVAINACDDKLSRQLDNVKSTWEEVGK